MSEPMLINVVEVTDTEQQDLPAGEFGGWLHDSRRARAVGGEMNVPCGACDACCRSSHFVHVEPDEDETLARIPQALLFPAPGLPDGHRVMGYDRDGCCPMLGVGGCSIYEHRPKSCRSYDCRVFSAAGVRSDKPLVDARVRRWRFHYASPRERLTHGAILAAARFIAGHAGDLGLGSGAASPTGRALAALDVYPAMIEGYEQQQGDGRAPSSDGLASAMRALLGTRDTSTAVR